MQALKHCDCFFSKECKNLYSASHDAERETVRMDYLDTRQYDGLHVFRQIINAG